MKWGLFKLNVTVLRQIFGRKDLGVLSGVLATLSEGVLL